MGPPLRQDIGRIEVIRGGQTRFEHTGHQSLGHVPGPDQGDLGPRQHGAIIRRGPPSFNLRTHGRLSRLDGEVTMNQISIPALLSLFCVCALYSTESFARREILSKEQKDRREKIERVEVEVVAITDKGNSASASLTEVVVRRLREIGYTVLTDPSQPSDLTFKVKCEQRKVWEGTSASGGDADLPDSPSRVWKGPACQITYLLDGKKMGWHKEVRTDFQDAIQAAEQAKAGDPGVYAMAKLKDRLEQYYFPALVAAELGQEARLLKALDEPSA